MRRLNLAKLYGPDYKENFNALVSNIFHPDKRSSAHHCPDCRCVPTKRCFEKFHIAFCLACGYRFSVKHGCDEHRYTSDEGERNMVFKRRRNGWK
ncbi:hypothetical protein IQ06DRAFT_350425 [Phaeosphaeriaceae sp. SRC1lsM3a]|nr:hypothetical protein IQ06DRAFT_350425 [Stagonospora sp. SRC1lsM3a]